jgi:hypothetical protein
MSSSSWWRSSASTAKLAGRTDPQGRLAWRRLQTGVVVRDCPKEAVRVLEDLGYKIEPPTEPRPESSKITLCDDHYRSRPAQPIGIQKAWKGLEAETAALNSAATARLSGHVGSLLARQHRYGLTRTAIA